MVASRQYHRGAIAEQINGAPVIDGLVAGLEWRMAWLIVATFLAGEGRFNEIEEPRAWLLRKEILTDARNS